MVVLPAHAQSAQSPSWGAIASVYGAQGYAFNHPSRAAAEAAARAQCDRAARRPGACAVTAYFNRSCGALATGNYGEWGAATALTADAATQAAVGQCDAHLPTQPCKAVVTVCSPR
ncbi:DUF4189 domain-containing protein [Variovorax sp. PAMC 28711]|uniref:DUF4189 domain-containing protein n=1 Tax=Variovorax sp. PAMC 28711 TaxID=1795631 RepID=UPI00143CB80B|nr:DUF4189 domain-containing protein [Variovorax sp. PAMC 28711]